MSASFEALFPHASFKSLDIQPKRFSIEVFSICSKVRSTESCPQTLGPSSHISEVNCEYNYYNILVREFVSIF